jgi:hypothetical protein
MERIAKETMEEQYRHIPGWGIDADPENEPTYPMKHYNGADHQRLNYQRPPLQPETVEVLHSNERPNLTAAFGTVSPPSGVSGAIRRYAFKYSEGQWRHWLLLILADRVNSVEGIVDDLSHGHVPNIVKERGWNAEWKYNRQELIKKAAIGAGVAVAAVLLMSWRNKRKKSLI